MTARHGTVLILSVICTVSLAGCSGTTRTGTQVPWSINNPELAVRLIVRNTEIEQGMRPVCFMEVMNTSRKTVLLRKDFSLNGPAVYDAGGRPMPQRRILEVRPEDTGGYHRLEPGEKLFVKARPNYKMAERGKYTLRFGIQPSLWGFEDPKDPGRVLRGYPRSDETAVSNEVIVSVF